MVLTWLAGAEGPGMPEIPDPPPMATLNSPVDIVTVCCSAHTGLPPLADS